MELRYDNFLISHYNIPLRPLSPLSPLSPKSPLDPFGPGNPASPLGPGGPGIGVMLPPPTLNPGGPGGPYKLFYLCQIHIYPLLKISYEDALIERNEIHGMLSS